MRRHDTSRFLERAAAAILVIALVITVAVASGVTSHDTSSSDLEPTIAAPTATEPTLADTGPTDAPPTATSAPIPVPTATVPSGDHEDASPEITAEHVFAFNVDSNATLYSLDANAEVPIASTVKIATALVAVRTLDLDDQITIEESDLVDPTIYSNMMLVAGDILTVDQLLQGLLIPSGSDAANALARATGEQLGGDDPVAAFVGAMNDLAAELGLQHTHFTNPTGDDDADGYSSAHDIAVLGAVLMDNLDLAAIVGQSSYAFESPGGNHYEGVTTNQLLGQDGVAGIKTGSTGDAGGCVILYRESPSGQRMVIAILDAALTYQENIIVQDSRWDDARQIIAAIDADDFP
jgi:D-alanyl-D-alanine carboxypeptidase (penicillin-binding protein 5/6)